MRTALCLTQFTNCMITRANAVICLALAGCIFLCNGPSVKIRDGRLNCSLNDDILITSVRLILILSYIKVP